MIFLHLSARRYYSEVLYRVLMKAAAKYGFVTAALIFGAYHILNPSARPASILGLCTGFLVYKTGSFASSMPSMQLQTYAILFGGVLIINMQGSNLVWLCAVAVAGAFISVALLRSVKEEARSDENGEEANNGSKISAAGILFLVLSAVYLVTIGVLEIMSR